MTTLRKTHLNCHSRVGGNLGKVINKALNRIGSIENKLDSRVRGNDGIKK